LARIVASTEAGAPIGLEKELVLGKKPRRVV